MSIVGRSSQTPRFSPDSLPGLRLWLDAADRDSVVLSGSNVTQWNDKSGNLRNGTPVNSLTYSAASNAVVFTRSSSQYLTLPDNTFPIGSSSFSIFFVFTPTATSYEIQLITAGARGGNIFGIRSGNAGTGTLQTFWSGNNDIQTSNLWARGQRNIGALLHQVGGTRSLWINGVQGASDTPGAQTAITTSNCIGTLAPGAFNTFDGQMHEVLVFESSLSVTERQQVESYLAQRWDPAPSPLSVPGCVFWLDAGDRSTLTLSASNTITGWTEKSGANRTVTTNSTGIYSATAMNGRPGIQFSAGNVMTSSTAATLGNNLTVFAVFMATSEGPRQLNVPIFVGSSANGYWLTYRGDFQIYQARQEGGSQTANSYFRNINIPVIMAGVASATASQQNAFLNGYSTDVVNSAPLSNVGATTIYIPGGEPYWGGPANGMFNGVISEILIFSNALTTTQRQTIEGYLSSKWGISVNVKPPFLPSTHAFPRAPPPVRPFSPLDVDGLSLWLDATDPATLTLSGSNVTQWRDKSGSDHAFSNHVGTTTLASNVQSGQNAVYFNGASSLNNTTLVFPSAAYSVFIVAYQEALVTTGGNYARLLNGGGAGTDARFFLGVLGSNYATFTGTTGGWNEVNANSPATSIFQQWSLLGVTVSGSNLIPYVSGVAQTLKTTGTTGAFTGLSIGGAQSGGSPQLWVGHVGELLVYSNVLSTAQRQQVETYLAEKWGLRGRMGGTPHPFRFGPAVVLPTSIPGCALWLDATDSTSMTLSGSNLSQWRDKSSNAFAGTAVSSPTLQSNSINGLSAVQFNGSSQYITFGNVLNLGTSSISVFAVTRFTGDAGIVGKTSSRWVSGRWGLYRFASDGGLVWYADASPSGANIVHADTKVADTTTTTRLLQGSWDRSTLSLTQNGTQRASNTFVNTSNLSNTDTLLVGGYGNGDGTGVRSDFFLNGVIGEILVYLGALTVSQRQQVEGYLAWKWGLQANLPGSVNPFASLKRALAPPFVPNHISGCTLWLDGADTTSLTLSGSNVTQWRDKSGSSNHYTNNGTVAYQSNGLYFNGSADIRNTTLTGFPFGATPSVSTFFVFSVQNVTSLRPLMSYGAVGCDKTGYVLYIDTDSRLYGTLYCGAASVSTGVRMNTTNIVSDVMTYTGTSGSITRAGWLNGAAMSTPTGSATGVSLTNWGITYIGAIGDGGGNIYPGWYFLGTIHEVLYFNRALSASERRRIEGYLGWKWNLLGTLGGVEHPNRLSPAAILPTDIAGCVLWLDAEDSATFTLSGSNVTQWRDKSGLGNHGTPTGTVTRTTAVFGGRSSVSFNGSTVRGSVSVTGPELTVIAVYQPNEVRGDRDQRVVSFANPGESDWNSVSRTTGLNIQGGGASLLSTYRNVTMLAQSVSSHIANSPFIGCARYTGSAAAVFLNATEGTALSATSGNFGISTYGLANQASGSPETLNGHIAEVIVYTVAITTTQRQQLESYLAWKWGIQSVLPSASHPYRTFKP